MDIRIIREEPQELELEMTSESHTFCKLLTDRLSESDKVVYAAYRIDHPLAGAPVLYLKVKEGIKVPKREEKKVDIAKVVGVGPKRKEQLQDAGITYANDLLKANLEELSQSTGIPLKNLESMVEEAGKLDFGGLTAPRFVLLESLKGIDEEFSELGKSSPSKS